MGSLKRLTDGPAGSGLFANLTRGELEKAYQAATKDLVDPLPDRAARGRPELGRPLADRIAHSRLSNLKELRPGSAGRSEISILYIFDPRRNAVLLVAGDKAGQWEGWYRTAIPLAEERYEDCLKQEGIR